MTCPLCNQPFTLLHENDDNNNTSNLSATSCGHLVHSTCLENMGKNKYNCQTCGKPIMKRNSRPCYPEFAESEESKPSPPEVPRPTESNSLGLPPLKPKPSPTSSIFAPAENQTVTCEHSECQDQAQIQNTLVDDYNNLLSKYSDAKKKLDQESATRDTLQSEIETNERVLLKQSEAIRKASKRPGNNGEGDIGEEEYIEFVGGLYENIDVEMRDVDEDGSGDVSAMRDINARSAERPEGEGISEEENEESLEEDEAEYATLEEASEISDEESSASEEYDEDHEENHASSDDGNGLEVSDDDNEEDKVSSDDDSEEGEIFSDKGHEEGEVSTDEEDPEEGEVSTDERHEGDEVFSDEEDPEEGEVSSDEDGQVSSESDTEMSSDEALDEDLIQEEHENGLVNFHGVQHNNALENWENALENLDEALDDALQNLDVDVMEDDEWFEDL